MKTNLSRDGTRIATYCSGAGAPLVLVQGTGAARPDAWPAFPGLAQRFQVTTMDRRGRGNSDDSPDYELAREFEDVAAVVEDVARSSGQPANLLGHSFGGLLALEAALLTGSVRKLVLYEPAMTPPGTTPFSDGFIDHMQELLEAGDVEGALAAHYREIGMTDQEIAQLKASPAWQERLAAAHTTPRELRAVEQYTFHAARFQDLSAPTLLLIGSDSADLLKASTEPIHTTLPDSRIAILPDQEHIAMYTAPELFVREVQAFLLGS